MATINMNLHSISSITFAITLSIIYLYTFLLIEANYSSFTVELIHQDSAKSPHYDPSLTPWERSRNAIQLSNTRVNRFMSTLPSPEKASAEIINAAGEYFIEMSIGTPPVQFIGFADTASRLSWIQCMPCMKCYEQQPPPFYPKSSSTYEDVLFGSKLCKTFGRTFSIKGSKLCHYSIQYMDQSYTKGSIATDTITLSSTTGRPITLPRIIFGCGNDNNGFSSFGSGLIGLGWGTVSFISQASSLINGKFSYCLVPNSSPTKSSKMNFGDNTIVSGNEVLSTPLVLKSPFYRLTLKGLSVGGKRLKFYNSSSVKTAFKSSKGNMIIDSGARLTYLPSTLYNPLESQMKRAITSLKPIDDPKRQLKLCYMAEDVFDAPIVTVHFHGADVKLNPMNTFIRIANYITCFAFLPHKTMPVYGNLAQTNFLVGYDLIKKTVSFKPTDCSRF